MKKEKKRGNIFQVLEDYRTLDQNGPLKLSRWNARLFTKILTTSCSCTVRSRRWGARRGSFKIGPTILAEWNHKDRRSRVYVMAFPAEQASS